MIDFHVNSFRFDVLSEIAGNASRSFFVQQLFASQSSPDEMKPAAGVGMHRHRADRKPLKRLMSTSAVITGLKAGVNESDRGLGQFASPCYPFTSAGC
jgi:hypothetical protein